MVDIDQFVKEVKKKKLDPKEVFQEAVTLKFVEDSLMIENWKVLWAFCMFRGRVPNFVMEYFESLK